jgi:hypothetical protein
MTYQYKETKMNVGNTVYRVVVDYYSSRERRKLHTFTDSEGVIWHRYEQLEPKLVIREITIIGKLEYVLTGRLPEDANPEEYIDSTVYYGQYISEADNTIQYTSFYEADSDICVNRADAETRAQELDDKLAPHLN